MSTKISVSEEYTVQTGHFCDPNTNMTSTTLDEAKLECSNDESCAMFYEDCAYPRFRKCSENVYVEESQCGEQLGPSILYTKGNMKNYMTKLSYHMIFHRHFWNDFSVITFLLKFIGKEEDALDSSVTRPSRPTWDYATRQPKPTKKPLSEPKMKNSAAGKR